MIRGAALALALLQGSCVLCKCDGDPPEIVPGTYAVTEADDAEWVGAVAVLEEDALTLSLEDGTSVTWWIE